LPDQELLNAKIDLLTKRIQWFYDKDTYIARTNNTLWPDETPAQNCLNKVTEGWISPWWVTKHQHYSF
jgi:hypothetical protein